MTDSPRPALIPVSELVAMLRDRIEPLARTLLPDGHRDRDEWREARRCHGGLGDSLSVNIAPGSRCGLWAHHAADKSGDALDLIVYLKGFATKAEAIGWAKGWLGLDGSNPAAIVGKPPRKSDARAEDDGPERRRAAAHHIYLSAVPIAGTAAERYLAGRGLPVARLGFPLRSLRFHGSLWDRHTKRAWPAMVAAITAEDGRFMAVHQTYLQCGRDGSVRKAPIVDEHGAVACKRVLGSYRGGAIRLWRGVVADPRTGEIKQARPLARCKSGVWVDITEGIEDGLSVALADPEARVLAAVSLSNMANIKLPPCVEGVVIWRQRDPPGSPADIAMAKTLERFAAMGKRVAEVWPPDGCKDVNELVQQAPASAELGAAANG